MLKLTTFFSEDYIFQSFRLTTAVTYCFIVYLFYLLYANKFVAVIIFLPHKKVCHMNGH